MVVHTPDCIEKNLDDVEENDGSNNVSCGAQEQAIVAS